MRLIDADALKETFEIAYKEVWHDREYSNAFFSDGGAVSTEWWCVEDMVDNAPTIETQQWISVSERLPEFRHVINPDPEEDGEWDESPFVLVCFDDGDIECRQFIREDGEVFVYPEEFRGRKPVAWQPLPDPWEEEE